MISFPYSSPGLKLRGFLALACVLVVGGVACSSKTVHADKAGNEPSDLIAKVGEAEIALEEVESLMASDLMKLDQQRQEILQKGLDAVISKKLVEIEAGMKSLTVEALIEQQVESKVTAPTAQEVDAFYEERRSSIKRPKEEVASQIEDHLQSLQRQAIAANYLSELRRKHTVRSFLEPFRVEVQSVGSPSYGPDSAPVTIVEFSDFQCPFCSRVLPTFEAVKKNYGDKVRIVFRQFPLSNIHPQAQKAAEASLCADDQGKFWEMHDQMFSNQTKLGVPDLKMAATGLGLDNVLFDECLDSGKYSSRVLADLEAGTQLGVTGTPAMFINGRFLSGAQPYPQIASIIDDELARLVKDVVD